MSLFATDYLHCDRLMPLSETPGNTNALDFAKQLASGAADGLMSGTLQEEFWNALKGRITAHLLDDYRKLIG
jgi:hypothetical protein